MLKSDLHLHADSDEHHKLSYTSKELINYASKLGFEVLSITNHNTLRHTNELAAYAKKKNILLIPGTELEIEGKEVILLNIKKDTLSKIKTFDDLERYRGENMLVMAPHPFYPHYRSLHSKLASRKELFDAVEYCHFYLPHFNFFNNRAEKFAKKNKLPLVGTSDAHHLFQMNHTFSLIDSDKKVDSVLEAIRKHKVRVKTEPLPISKLIKVFYWIFF